MELKCPFCQTDNQAGAKYCISCGAKLPEQSQNRAAQAETMKKAGSSVFAFGAEARKQRVMQAVEPGALISDNAYNGVIVGVLLWGLIINYILCRTVGDVFRYVSPTIFFIGYIVMAIAGILISSRSQNVIVSFIGYNLVVVPFGLVISTLVEYYAEVDPSIVTNAFLYTFLIAAGMLVLAVLKPSIFASLGGALGSVLLGLILCEVVLLLFRVQQHVTDWIAAGLFSLYIGYDIYRSQQYPKTMDNAVDSALDIYMDIANLFIRILSILGDSKDRGRKS